MFRRNDHNKEEEMQGSSRLGMLAGMGMGSAVWGQPCLESGEDRPESVPDRAGFFLAAETGGWSGEAARR